MSYFAKWMIHSTVIFILTNPLWAADEPTPVSKDWLTVQKTCDDQWNYEQNGHHRHIGKAVCACFADALVQFKSTHQKDYINTLEYQNYYKQASQICTTSGVLANSIDRAIYDRVYDAATIQNLCRSSWVGLMGSFHPVDVNFNSAKICQCAAPELTKNVALFDNLPPKELRLRSLALVKSCDPTAKLSSAQFASLDNESKKQAQLAVLSKGKFILEIKDDPNYKELAQYLRKDGRLKDIVAALNQSIKIPYDIRIIITTTGVGPYYIYKDKTINLDYKLMSIIPILYDKYHPLESAQNRHHYINNVNRFFLYHELGHALIDAYKLPVLGQEEDGADALSAVISLKYLPQGFQVMVDAADFFYLFDKVVGVDASSYWDEHGLNKQRYYRLLCYGYGKAPKSVEQKIEHYYQGGLKTFLTERADYCQDEYNTTYASWMSLLKPYLKTNLSDQAKTGSSFQ